MDTQQPVSDEVMQSLNRLEEFVLRYNEGRDTLTHIKAPGLHSLLVAYQYMKFVGQPGNYSLLHHSYHGDFFNKTYDILQKLGLTEENAPEVYSYIKYLQKLANSLVNVKDKADINIQLFGFLQGLTENLLYTRYVSNTQKEIPELVNRNIFKKLLVAADSFIAKDEKGNLVILAGYPWFDQSWGRDTFISLPGLMLVTLRHEEAKEIFRYYAKHQNEEGLIPNRIFLDGSAQYNTADGSLWFIESLYKYYQVTKDEKFISEMLPVVNKIIECYKKPYTKETVYMDKDNLIVVPSQWTWMDTKYTPRNGKPIEIQALFYNALKITAEFNRLAQDKDKAEELDELANKIKIAIHQKFFIDRDYPYDVIDGDIHSQATRPNAVFLLSLSHTGDLLYERNKKHILEIIERELLTPYGLRTLSPQDNKYIGKYDTFAPPETKDQAYHQGTIWPYLISHYIFAKIKLMKDRPYNEVITEVKNNINNLIYLLTTNNTLPEVFSGDAPHLPGGTVSQAWSIAAILEIFDLLNQHRELPSIDTKQLPDISVRQIRNLLGAG